ncbi:hypothetical protein [uncultured Polaribacter sp.]|uniref:hypothetical protein n=1 Tax=uncultured Polaribacter sp. TaxID=174711 RepID=UPI002609B4C7|nr:hypothetical protein [uncultured Polaribacter sp.]
MDKLKGLETWHQFLETRNIDGLKNLIADEAVLYSPVVFTPIKGKFMVSMYLTAAAKIIANGYFKYIREVCDEENALLEFETEISDVSVNGIDMIKFNEEGQLKEIKVMIRPLKAINIVHQKMGEYLEKMKNS